jgi:hypothetical protein
MIGGAPARTKMLPVAFHFGPSCGRPNGERAKK